MIQMNHNVLLITDHEFRSLLYIHRKTAFIDQLLEHLSESIFGYYYDYEEESYNRLKELWNNEKQYIYPHLKYKLSGFLES